jgi:hypothetical protein
MTNSHSISARAALLLTFAISATGQENDPEKSGVRFPELTGPFQVGRAQFHLVDLSRKEVFTAAPDDVRELMVTVHYPAELAAGRSASPYVDAVSAAALAKAYLKPLGLFDLMHSHAVDQARVASSPSGFPLLIFSPGFKTHPLFYTAMLEELASQGFIVASLCHTYSTLVTVFPDGRAVRANDEGTRFEVDKKDSAVEAAKIQEHRDAIGEVWFADVQFVRDSFARWNRDDALLRGHVDMSRVGIFGHSFGGATAAAAVQRDKRFQAGINLDGSDFSGTRGDEIRDRFLWMCSVPPDFAKLPAPKESAAKAQPYRDQAGLPGVPPAREAGAEPALPGKRVILKRAGDSTPPPPGLALGRPNDGLRAPPGCRVTLLGSRHQAFTTDVDLLVASPPHARLALGEDIGKIDGRRAVTVINALVSGFFRKHLRGEDVSFLDDPSSEFPEAVRDTPPR